MPAAVIGTIVANAVVGAATTVGALLSKAFIPCCADSCVIDGAL